MATSRLLVLVTDQHDQPVADARVTIVPVSTTPPMPPIVVPLVFDLTRGRYVLDAGPVGTVRLHVRASKDHDEDDWWTLDRELTLRAGDNRAHATIGPRDSPSYPGANGTRVFVDPIPDQVAVYVRAPQGGLATGAEEFLDNTHLRWSPAHRPSSRAPREMCYLVDVGIPTSTERSGRLASLRNAVQISLPSRRLDAQIAAPMRRPDGEIESLSGDIIVRFHTADTTAEAELAVAGLGLDLGSPRSLAPLDRTFLFPTQGVPDFDALIHAVETLAGSPAVAVAEPSVIRRIVNDAVPQNFLFPMQEHFALIRAQEAWNLPTAAGDATITVAVIDFQGVQPTHPNLPHGFECFEFQNDAAVPVKAESFGREHGHGTACASVAVGRFSDSPTTGGTAGLAANCGLIGIRIPEHVDDTVIARAWLWAAGLEPAGPVPLHGPARPADVLSNSWHRKGALSQCLYDALLELVKTGRGGRGCVVCCSAGNPGNNVQLWKENPMAACDEVIAVGASTLGDKRASYSPQGPELDLVAPSSATPSTELPVTAWIRGEGTCFGEVEGAPTALGAGATKATPRLVVPTTDGFAAGQVVLLGEIGVSPFQFAEIQQVTPPDRLDMVSLAETFAAETAIRTGPKDYIQHELFGGTSYAAPLVAGAAALVLSANRQLRWDEVRRILCASADPIDGNSGTWGVQDGLAFSPWYGHGRLNVQRALQNTPAPAPGPPPSPLVFRS